jgi:hypothetical protein
VGRFAVQGIEPTFTIDNGISESMMSSHASRRPANGREGVGGNCPLPVHFLVNLLKLSGSTVHKPERLGERAVSIGYRLFPHD